MASRLDSSILGALRCFEAAGQSLSFTKTAATLSLTQSAVSQQIRQLEARLGYPLFVRQPRGLALTPKGAALLEATSNAFAELNRTLARLDEPEAALLNVSCVPSFALQWLMPRLVDFHRLHPYVSVRLKAEIDVVASYERAQGGADIAIGYLPPSEWPSDATVLLDESLVAAATPEYLREHPPVLDARWLQSVRLLHDVEPWAGAPEFVEWQTWLRCMLPGLDDAADGPHFNFNLSSLAISAALNHQGVVLARTALIDEELTAGRLIDIFQCHVRAPAQYVLLCRDRSDPRATAFVDWLSAECTRFEQARAGRSAPSGRDSSS